MRYKLNIGYKKYKLCNGYKRQQEVVEVLDIRQGGKDKVGKGYK